MSSHSQQQYKSYESVEEFLKDSREFLEQDEAVNNLMLGLLNSLIDGSYKCPNPLCFSIDAQFAMLMTAPHNLIIYGLETAIPIAIDFLLQNKIQIPGILGPRALAEAFVEKWQEKTGQKAEVKMKQLIYKLTKVDALEKSPGKMIKVSSNTHLNTLEDWYWDFNKDMPDNWHQPQRLRQKTTKTH